MTPSRENVALHEAGHIVVASALGVRPTQASILQGGHNEGWAEHARIPMPKGFRLHEEWRFTEGALYPVLADARTRRAVELAVTITVAGDVATRSFGEIESDFTGPIEASAIADTTPAPRLTPREVRTLQEVTDRPPAYSDDERATAICLAFAGPTASAFRALCEQTAWAVLQDNVKTLGAIATALLTDDVLGRKRLDQLLAA